MSAPLPSDEASRLAELYALGILDSASEVAFDDLVQTAGDLLDVPVALVSLIDADRQWFKAKIGLEVCETSRDVAFCAHAILQTEPLVVPDATRDPRFASNPLVTGEFHLRFYAGAQIFVRGKALGTLCCIDTEPREISDRQVRGLAGLARQVAQLIEARLLPQRLAESERKFSAFLEHAPIAAFVKDREGRTHFANPGFEKMFGLPPERALGHRACEWLPEALAQELQAADLKALDSQTRRESRECIPLPDGTSRFWQTLRFPLELGADPLLGVIALDVTKSVEDECKLRQQSEELAEAGKKLTSYVEQASLAREIAQFAATRFEHLFKGLPIACYTFDANGTIQEWNSAAEVLWGIDAFEATQQPVIGTAVCEENLDEFNALRQRVFNGETVYLSEHAETLRDGSTRYLLTSTIPLLGPTGAIVGALSANVDVTERHRVEAALAESEARFRAALHTMHEGILVRDAKQEVIVANERLCEILGLTFDELKRFAPSDPHWQAVHEDGSPWPVEEYPSLVALRTGIAQTEKIMGIRKSSGALTWVQINAVPMFPLAGGPAHAVVVTFNDITERLIDRDLIRDQLGQIQDYAGRLELQKSHLEEANAKLASLAATDALTGIYNHRTFQERLDSELSLAGRTGRPLSVVMIDVDKFKTFNDDFGHQVGDTVLKSVASILQSVSRVSDTVARYGGEEFVVILPDSDAEGAVALAERLRTSIVSAEWPARCVTASFGVATLAMGMTRDDLIRAADNALYACKAAGRNCVKHSRSAEIIEQPLA